jgi:phosphotriesterase-related protein
MTTVVSASALRPRPIESENYVDLYAARETQADETVRRLSSLKALGVDTLVDVNSFGDNRDITLVRRCMEQTGINIVVSTGLPVGETYPAQLQFSEGSHDLGRPARLAEWMVRDITEGVAGSGVRAGLISCVVTGSGQLSASAETTLHAIGQAHVSTGVPVLVRPTSPEAWSKQHRETLALAGVGPADLIVLAGTASGNQPFVASILEAGSRVCLTLVDLNHSDPVRNIGTLNSMVSAGLLDQILMEVDVAAPPDIAAPSIPELLRSAGVADDVAATLLAANFVRSTQ